MGNPVVHFEIAGRNGEGLEQFYSKLFGWGIERKKTGGFPYGFIKTGAEGKIDGGIRHEPEGKPEVVFYVEVPDLKVAVEKAKELGAQVRIPPMSVEDIHFAMITDPEGNPVEIIQEK